MTPERVLFIVAVLGSALYISLIFNDNLWVDEAFTASLIRQSFPEMIRDTVSDTLPPFYNVFGFLAVSLFGFSSVVLKFCSCLAMILLLFFGGRKLHTLKGFRAAFLYELFLVAMPHFLHYGVEIRMYSWGVFSCGMAALYFLEIPENRSAFRGFTLFSVFSGYIHHFALVSCGMLWLILLFSYVLKKNKEDIILFFKYLGLFLILYLPGLILTFYQIKNASSYFSMAPLSLKSFISDIRFPFVTNITPLSALLLLMAVFAAALPFIRKSVKDSSQGLLLMSAIYLTLCFAYAVSVISGRSLFTARYLVPCLSIFWLGTALLSDEALSFFGDKSPVAPVLIALIAVTLVTGYLMTFREEYSPGAEQMKAFFNENIKSGDAIIINEDVPEIEICFRYYFPDLLKTGWKNADNINGTIWYLVREGSGDVLENADTPGYNLEYICDFFFDRYSFSLYRADKR